LHEEIEGLQGITPFLEIGDDTRSTSAAHKLPSTRKEEYPSNQNLPYSELYTIDNSPNTTGPENPPLTTMVSHGRSGLQSQLSAEDIGQGTSAFSSTIY
jgi:hypothetical protein